MAFIESTSFVIFSSYILTLQITISLSSLIVDVLMTKQGRICGLCARGTACLVERAAPHAGAAREITAAHGKLRINVDILYCV